MTIPWQPGYQGNMIEPPGFVDPHDYSGVAAQVLAPLSAEPAGTLAAAIPRAAISSAAIAAVNTTGTVGVRVILLTAGLVISNVSVLTGSTAASGPTHFWLGLCDANLNVLGVSADQGAGAIPAGTFTTLPLTAKVTTQYTGLYYVAVSTSASTTAPTLAGIAAVAGSNAAPVMCGTAGVQATPPAVGAQLNAGAVTASAADNFAAWLS